ncbi:hypothetical protein [Streptomyces sp. AC555_RSS877]|uniref:hypothetical protein n=1 Tax=Streptomyces sp. AC555_RSS877 TaxID=2823688 RepID=UPI001C26E096|nr:hypothetical protein [Streptomyces sp. AC555_RSS877]
MAQDVGLALTVEDVLDGLSEDGRQEVMETIAAALARPESAPGPDGDAGSL